MKLFFILIVSIAIMAPLTSFARTPIEDDAMFTQEIEGNTQLLEQMVALVKANGYRCDSISAGRQMFLSRGFVLSCNNLAYEYEIEDIGGHWRVTAK